MYFVYVLKSLQKMIEEVLLHIEILEPWLCTVNLRIIQKGPNLLKQIWTKKIPVIFKLIILETKQFAIKRNEK